MSASSYSKPGVTISLILDDGEWRRASTLDGGITDYAGSDWVVIEPLADDRAREDRDRFVCEACDGELGVGSVTVAMDLHYCAACRPAWAEGEEWE